MFDSHWKKKFGSPWILNPGRPKASADVMGDPSYREKYGGFRLVSSVEPDATCATRGSGWFYPKPSPPTTTEPSRRGSSEHGFRLVYEEVLLDGEG